MRKLPQIRVHRRPGRKPYFEVRIRGAPIHLGTNPRAAKVEYAKLMKEHYGSEPRPGAPRGISELIEAWLVENPDYPYPEAVASYVKLAGSTAMDEIGPKHLKRYLAELKRGWEFEAKGRAGNSTGTRTGHYSPWSLRRRVGLARRILLWAQAEGWLAAVPPLPDLPSPVRLPRDVDPEKLRLSLAKLPERVQLLLRFMAETGARPSEAALLKWTDIHPERGVAVLIDHKTAAATKSAKSIIITEGARAVLEACKRDDSLPWVFPSRLRRPYTISGLRSIMRRNEVPITPYQLRHTFAQWLADSGVSVDDIAGFLGHKDSRTARFYMDIRGARLQRVASRLTGSLTQSPKSDPA